MLVSLKSSISWYYIQGQIQGARGLSPPPQKKKKIGRVVKT